MESILGRIVGSRKSLRILITSSIAALLIVLVKYVFHAYGWEPIEQSSLHNGVLSSATFVIGFLLSATIADYKESERIPAEFAAHIEDIYADAKAVHARYPGFDLEALRRMLQKIAREFERQTRSGARGASQYIRDLSPIFADMEGAGVPANFIVKLKQQQAQLLRHRKRVTYIQRIQFIPSATILSRSIVVMVIVLLVLTNVDPFYGSLAIIGIISFVLIYMMLLIAVISTPFHSEGKTQDDVSMFLVNDAIEYLRENK